jgi:hypothetical protein
MTTPHNQINVVYQSSLEENTLAKRRKPYAQVYQRKPRPAPLRRQERDEQIVMGLYRYRLLTVDHIHALWFKSKSGQPLSRQAVQKRLRRLYDHNLIDRLPMPLIPGQGRSPTVYALGERGADLVASALGIDRDALTWKPSHNQVGSLFLDHTLAVVSCRVVIDLLAASGNFEVVDWIDEFNLKAEQYKRPSEHLVPYWMEGDRQVRSYPDGYFALQWASANEPSSFFLEVDRGTISKKRWKNRIKAYLNFRDLAERHYNSQNFRVLTVTTIPSRADHLLAATDEAVEADDFMKHFWFSIQDQIDIWWPEKLLQPVWSVVGREELFSLDTTKVFKYGIGLLEVTVPEEGTYEIRSAEYPDCIGRGENIEKALAEFEKAWSAD